MPSFDSPPESSQPSPVRMLYLGHTGAGKTGSLCSLASAGFNVRILDIDAGTEIISGYMRDKEGKSIYLKPAPGLWDESAAKMAPSRISAVTITEKYKLQGIKAVPRGDCWTRLMNQLNDWKDGDSKLGNISTWGPSDILVIDGLSRFCEAAMNIVLAMNSRLLTGPQVGSVGDNDYTHAFKLVTDFLDLMKSEDIRCHIIMICHIQFIDEFRDRNTKERSMKGFPQTVGQRLAPKVGQYFNHTLRAKSTGSGPLTRRVIVTNNDEDIELKNANPLRAKPEYALATGLAEYFRDLGICPTSEAKS